MPMLNEMISGKYLKKEDVGQGKLVTIAGLTRVNVAKDGQEPEYKWSVRFRELEKPLLANKTNLKRLAKACASENTDDWIDQQVVLYDDPDVEFGGETTGGIRVRAPKTKAAPERPQGVPERDPKKGGGSISDMESDIPFSFIGRGAESYII